MRITRLYVWILGAALALEGIGMFILGAIPEATIPSPFEAFRPDPPHDALHVVWGVALLALPLLRPRTFRPEILATIFGVFYVGLGFLGVFVYHPFGLRLDLGQNAFHFTVGPIALGLGLWSLYWLERASRGRLAKKAAQG